MPVIVVTRLRLRDPALLDEFFTDAVAAIEQATKSDGNLGADALADANNAWWSVSSWQERRLMQAYVDSEPHLGISTRLDHFCDEATFVDWEQASADLPDWQTSWRHLTSDGKAAELTHPSAANRTRDFPPPLEPPPSGLLIPVLSGSTMTNDRLGPDVTAPTPAVRHGAVTRIPWVEQHLKWLYWACAAGLTPWVVYLYLSQAPRAQAHQIRLLAVGLILALIAGLLLTAWMYRRGFSRSVMAALTTFESPGLGLDVFEVLALAATGFALQRRPAIAAVPATITGTLLLGDAWPNVIPSTGMALYEGIVMAFVELPLAALSFWVAAAMLARENAVWFEVPGTPGSLAGGRSACRTPSCPRPAPVAAVRTRAAGSRCRQDRSRPSQAIKARGSIAARDMA